MSLSLLSACLWVLVATCVAFLPFRAQFPPGIVLLIAAPVLLVWLALDHGMLLAGVGVLGFASMFRNPLIYFAKRAFGQVREVSA